MEDFLMDDDETRPRNAFNIEAEKARKRHAKLAEKDYKEYEKEQERVQAIFAGTISGEPHDIHPCGLEFLKRNKFHIEDTVDIDWSEARFFAMDDTKEKFYFDPFPEKDINGGLDFKIYHVDKILDAAIYENQKYVEEPADHKGLHAEKQTTTRLERTVGVEITMDDPDRPIVHIPCMPYAEAEDDAYQKRYGKAAQILAFLMDAKLAADSKKRVLSKYIKPAVCKHCGAPIEGKVDVCPYCGSPLH
jgi:hypothetical protein